jgi:MoxR-like ATPase
MAKKFLKSERVERLQPIMNKEDIILIQEEVAKIKVHDDVITFIVEVMEATRKVDNLTLGASPRATLALIRAAQATAYLKERTYVIPDDVIGVIYPVLCHRFVQSIESRMNKVTSEQILKSLLIKVTIPILRDFS